MTEHADFMADARTLLGERGLTRDAELIEPWLTDWRGRFHGQALALASPASTAELSALMRLCARYNVPVVPQGGNSGMSGGATPDESGNSLLLSLRRMNAIRRVDASTREAVCEAGVILQTLHEAADAQNMRFPLTLGGKGTATIGGLIATNAGGTQVLRYGSMRSQVLGLEAVLADGSIFDAMVALKKDNRGFDLKQLMIGSEGTLGIVTAATLRLLPRIADRVVIWAGLDSIQTARRLLLLAQEVAGDALEGFEVMPRHSLEAVLNYAPQARSPLQSEHEWHALIELTAEAPEAERLRATADILLERAVSAELLENATIAANDVQAEAFWALRDDVGPAEKVIGPAMQHDISVPVESMADFVTEAIPAVEARFPGTMGVAFGHLGDGNVHFHVIAPKDIDRQQWEGGEAKAVSSFVYDLVTKWGGSISAEHGIGQLKTGDLQRLGNTVQLGMMRAVKQAMDPAGLLNPGKLLPPCD